jgi:hypothetical protein
MTLFEVLYKSHRPLPGGRRGNIINRDVLRMRTGDREPATCFRSLSFRLLAHTVSRISLALSTVDTVPGSGTGMLLDDGPSSPP